MGQEKERELLEVPDNSEEKSKRLENMLYVLSQEGNSSSNKKEGKKDISHNSLPPWKRNPTGQKSDVLERAKSFLAMCKTVGNQKVTENCIDQDKNVVMDVHLGVFDVNGRLPTEEGSAFEKEIVNVAAPRREDLSHNEPCQIEEFSDFDDPDSEFSPEIKTQTTQMSEKQRAIKQFLSKHRSGNKDSKNASNLVEVVSSSDNAQQKASSPSPRNETHTK